ncbi:MAG: ribosomal protein L7/L12 [Pirellulales bacterium]|nr:ribosomal protein L7/L12 [Pirellulales bacterium]
MPAPPLTDQQRQAINQALFTGQRIQAIKEYREATGLGLADSKKFIDELETQLRLQTPENFTSPPAQGCLGVLSIFAGLLTIGGAVSLALFILLTG